MTTLILDLSNLIHRAWHAAGEAEALGVLCGGVAKLLRRLEPDHAVAVVDGEGPTWRHDLLPTYKGDREAKSDRFVAFYDRALEVLGEELFCLGEAGFEADDVAASVVHGLLSIDEDVELLTGDHDWLQLVTDEDAKPQVSCWLLSDGKVEKVGGLYVRERYGVAPHQLPHLRALVGKRADGVPGVPGIGEAKAATLIRHYGSIGQIYTVDAMGRSKAHQAQELEGIGPTLRDHLIEAEEDVKLALQLCTLRRDVPSCVIDVQVPALTSLDYGFYDLAIDWRRAASGLVHGAPHPAFDSPDDPVGHPDSEGYAAVDLPETTNEEQPAPAAPPSEAGDVPGVALVTRAAPVLPSPASEGATQPKSGNSAAAGSSGLALSGGPLHLIQPPEAGLSDEQWEQRQGRISSSLVPQILGVSRWGGPYSAWATVTGRKQRGETSEPAELGLLYERAALSLLAKRHEDWTILHNRGKTWERGEWAAATPDALVNEAERLVEVKHRSRPGSDWGTPGTADVPLDVLVQCLWQMWVVGPRECVVALGAYLTLREYPIPWQQAAVEQLVDRLRTWYERYVLGDEEPTVADALPDTLAALRAVHGEVTGEILDPDDKVLELARRRHVFAEREKAARERKRLIDARLEQICGNASGIEGVLSRYEVRGRVDYKALAEAADVPLELYRGEPSTRTRFTWRPSE